MMKNYLKSHLATPVACLAALTLVLCNHALTVLATNGTAMDESTAEESTNEESTSEDSPEALASSDERPLYTEETRPDFPVFNSLVGEEDFLSVTSPDGTVTQGEGEVLELQLGQEYVVTIAYDNNGLPTGVRTRAIANDTKVKVALPATISSERPLTATISANNSQPQSVSSSLTLVASEPMALEAVSGSAKIVNHNPTDGDIISIDKLLGSGAPIGTNSMVGIVMYGPENAGSVVFSFRTIPLDEAASNTKTSAEKQDTTTAVPAASAAAAADANFEWTTADTITVTFAALVLVAVVIYYRLQYPKKTE